MCRNKQFQDEGKLKHLAEMLWYADQAYEGESERTLSKRLEKRGACTPNSHPGRAQVWHVKPAWARPGRLGWKIHLQAT